MKKKLKLISKLFAIITLLAFTITSCDKKTVNPDENPDNNENEEKTEYVLQIENGAQTIEPNQTITYSAVMVSNKGNVTTPSNISWSVSETSIATISSSGVIATVGTGNTKVTASVTLDGKTYTASVPIGIYAPLLFTVAPSAIIYEKGGEIQLETVYFTTGATPSYTYNSTNPAIATVSSTGLISFVGIGECVINVTANTLPNQPFQIPVLVIGVPEVVLPITRIELNKASKDLFKNETYTFTATAYNPDGIVNNATFNWACLDNNIATIDANGKVTPKQTGKTYIQASSQGIIAQAEIIVNPDTIIIVSPFYKDLSPGDEFQFTATAYKNERNVTLNTAQQYDVNFVWSMLDYGAGFEMFNIGTVDNTGTVTIKNDAMIGMNSFVIAQVQDNQYIIGGAMITVGYDLP